MSAAELTRRQALSGAAGALAACADFPALSAFDDLALSPEFVRLRGELVAALRTYRQLLRCMVRNEAWVAWIADKEAMKEEYRDLWRKYNPFAMTVRDAHFRINDAMRELFVTRAQTSADHRLRLAALEVQEAETGEYPCLSRVAFAWKTVDLARQRIWFLDA